MTSPALRMTTRSPISTPLRRTSSALCRVASATWTRPPPPAHLRERRDPAGAPDVDLDVEELGERLLRRVLERDRPARGARGGAEAALQGDLVDLDHHAVDLVLDVVAVLAPVLDVRDDLVDPGDDPGPFGDRQPPGVQGVVELGLALEVEPDPLAEPVADQSQVADAVTRGSFWRSEPAAVLRGLANGGLPASTSVALSASKSRGGSRPRRGPR